MLSKICMVCYKGELVAHHSLPFFLDDISEYINKSKGVEFVSIAICKLLFADYLILES